MNTNVLLIYNLNGILSVKETRVIWLMKEQRCMYLFCAAVVYLYLSISFFYLPDEVTL